MVAITQLGSAWALAILTIVVALVKKSWQLAIRFFSVGVLTYLSAILLKHLVGRPRPYQQMSDVVQRDKVGTYDFGYPSGHSAMVIVAALLLLPLIPRPWRWLLTVLVVLVGASRMYLGVHFPLDIVGGYFLGWSVVSLVEFHRKLLAKPHSKA
jgi:undecaprenyl-diphosphatase